MVETIRFVDSCRRITVAGNHYHSRALRWWISQNIRITFPFDEATCRRESGPLGRESHGAKISLCGLSPKQRKLRVSFLVLFSSSYFSY